MSKKVWNLMYVAGNPAKCTRVIANAGNPMSRSEVLAAAELVPANGWRLWVEHQAKSERIFESRAEREHKANYEATHIVDFAKSNVPGNAYAR